MRPDRSATLSAARPGFGRGQVSPHRSFAPYARGRTGACRRLAIHLTSQGFVASQLFMTSYRDELRQRMDKQASERRAKNAVPSTPSKAHPRLTKLDWTANQPLLQPLVFALLVVAWLLKKAFHLAEQLAWAAIHMCVNSVNAQLTVGAAHLPATSSSGPAGCSRAVSRPRIRPDRAPTSGSTRRASRSPCPTSRRARRPSRRAAAGMSRSTTW